MAGPQELRPEEGDALVVGAALVARYGRRAPGAGLDDMIAHGGTTAVASERGCQAVASPLHRRLDRRCRQTRRVEVSRVDVVVLRDALGRPRGAGVERRGVSREEDDVWLEKEYGLRARGRKARRGSQHPVRLARGGAGGRAGEGRARGTPRLGLGFAAWALGPARRGGRIHEARGRAPTEPASAA